ncbi:L-threonylcarbamoyladenylate synthase [Salinibacter grassmerensis]|uniref:L-threonylcarbamoyladenylate synthase n=1 Tax=Salinibacter grassmerensis TaxID=3040353 RepID=UPI0021E73094|nr:L-threonylcarbamoyladenylate synthase [Salinibacter grassmerensis]
MATTRTTSPTEAAHHLRRGNLVAFPTETVYGLGADAFRPDAVRRIFEAKGRPADNPLIVHLRRQEQIGQVAARIPPVAQHLLDTFVPGPLTLILPKHDNLPSVVTADLETVGIRVPRLPLAQSFLEACDTPVPAPSANRSGRPSPTSWEAVEHDLGGRIDCILQGGRTDAGVESTVVDCTTDPATVLRPGAVSVESLRRTLGEVQVASSDADAAPRSPGTRHRHYAPSAQVQLVEDPSEAASGDRHAYVGLDAPAHTDALGAVYIEEDVRTYAHDLFHIFRVCDENEVEVIYAQTVSPTGLGRALNDRLRRAAAR